MASRQKKQKALQNGPDRPIDRRNRWPHSVHRGTAVDFVSSGIIVDAKCPEELVEKTDAEFARRALEQDEN